VYAITQIGSLEQSKQVTFLKINGFVLL